jgi:hypothetical protein
MEIKRERKKERERERDDGSFKRNDGLSSIIKVFSNVIKGPIKVGSGLNRQSVLIKREVQVLLF